MMKPKIYNIVPIAKCRMTQRDKWKKRPCVMRYMAFKDLVALHRVKLPKSGAHVLFVLPMPKSWSKQRKQIMAGQPHEQVPDWDNLGKALSDAVYRDDSAIWDIRITKVWGYEGRIEIRT